jgi:hypothetical protein
MAVSKKDLGLRDWTAIEVVVERSKRQLDDQNYLVEIEEWAN